MSLLSSPLSKLSPVLLGLLLMAGLSGCQSSSTSPQLSAETMDEPGAKIFQMNCAICHGINNGPKVMTQYFPISHHSQSESAFIAFLRTKKTFSMPAFSEEEITDAEASELYQWLIALNTPQP